MKVLMPRPATPRFTKHRNSGIVNWQPHSEEAVSLIVNDFDFSRLSAEERILLAQELWDSVHQDAQAAPLTPQQRAELDRRFSQLESGEVPGIPWEQLRESLLPKR
jgi:putative addiction module component (TIGR02574 family)